jgi:hypothetical protein
MTGAKAESRWLIRDEEEWVKTPTKLSDFIIRIADDPSDYDPADLFPTEEAARQELIGRLKKTEAEEIANLNALLKPDAAPDAILKKEHNKRLRYAQRALQICESAGQAAEPSTRKQPPRRQK